MNNSAEIASQQEEEQVSEEFESAGSDSEQGQGQEEEDPEQEPSGDQAPDPRTKGFLQHGCEHYRRRCKLVSPCCNDVVWCRHCHNVAKSDNEQDPKKRHTLDRKAVTEVVCALCDLRQPAATTCSQCGVSFGKFACMACKFYDDDVTKNQFHCDQCGICRVGGRENYFHCQTCNCCYAKELRDTHVCIENSMHKNCPVCLEYLFDSVKPINVMRCGHTIHQECLRGMAQHRAYSCPLCSKSWMNASNLEALWDNMDQAVAATVMPEEYRDMQVDILCNDCNERCKVTFHVVGHKCSSCGGYNTRRV